jgi:hypothetical protein
VAGLVPGSPSHQLPHPSAHPVCRHFRSDAFHRRQQKQRINSIL